MTPTAYIFRSAPHGSASGREGLDALLAASAVNEELTALFIEDGVYQLLREQQPQQILGRDYAPTFKMLDLYDVEHIYVCAESMAARGLSTEDLLIDVTPCLAGISSLSSPHTPSA